MIEIQTDPPPESLVQSARTVLARALDPDLQDDRFGSSWARSVEAGPFVGSIGIVAGEAVAYLGGVVEDNVLQLDSLIVPDQLYQSREVFADLLTHTMSGGAANIHRVELWAKPAFDWHGTVAAEFGFEPLRALHQMRCALPVEAEPVPTRPFVLGQDDEALRRVNNRAFASHPDQGNMSQADLEASAAEPWFDPNGIRLYEVEGELAGFCWTKVHDEPRLGEIYAIGIDPDHHGKGLGVPMTAAGLQWLADRGLTTGMLYVEADNEPALRTYDRLGFEILRTDRAWVLQRRT